MTDNIKYFEDTLLSDRILDALYDMHFDTCTPIQAACIDPIIEASFPDNDFDIGNIIPLKKAEGLNKALLRQL